MGCNNTKYPRPHQNNFLHKSYMHKKLNTHCKRIPCHCCENLGGGGGWEWGQKRNLGRGACPLVPPPISMLDELLLLNYGTLFHIELKLTK